MSKKKNAFDKAIAVIDPQRALKRAAARKKLDILNSTYEGPGGGGYARHGANTWKKSLVGWFSRAGSPDDDIIGAWGSLTLKTLRARCRDLHMGAPLATGAINTISANVVGPGLHLKPKIDATSLGITYKQADEWQKQVEREFETWCKECDAERTSTFGELQEIAFASALISGDVFALTPMFKNINDKYLLKVLLIEADRVETPPEMEGERFVRGGIKFDQRGAPVDYYIRKYHPFDSRTYNTFEYDTYPAFGKLTGRRNVIHLFSRQRPGQKRGVPLLAPVIETMKQLSRYTDAELMAALISGMFTVFVKTDISNEEVLADNIPVGEQIAGSNPLDYELGNGAIVGLNPGESIQETNPNRPNVAFDGFVQSLCRQIGAGIELPYELLVKHFTASYSASRAALLEAWKTFRKRRNWMASKFCQPIYEEWLTEAVATGRVIAPGFLLDKTIRVAYCRAEWYGPTQGQIDPEKEVKAAILRVENNFSTRDRETTELTGGDFEDNIRQRVREEMMIKKGGLQKVEQPKGKDREPTVLEDDNQREE